MSMTSGIFMLLNSAFSNLNSERVLELFWLNATFHVSNAIYFENKPNKLRIFYRSTKISFLKIRFTSKILYWRLRRCNNVTNNKNIFFCRSKCIMLRKRYKYYWIWKYILCAENMVQILSLDAEDWHCS